MDFKPMGDLMDEYRSQVDKIDRRIKGLHIQVAKGVVGAHEKIERLYSIRSDLIYSIRLMSKYRK